MGFVCPKSHRRYSGISKNKFTIQETDLPIASKRRVTHYPRVTKKENQTWPMASTINQVNKVLLRAKMIHICGVHLGLLPQTFLGGSYLWVISVSISFFAIFGWLLPLSQTLLFRVPCASVLVYMFNSKKDMYFNSIFFSSDLPWGFMPAYSIPEGYVHKYGGDLARKAHLRGFLNMHGDFLGDSDSRGSFSK